MDVTDDEDPLKASQQPGNVSDHVMTDQNFPYRTNMCSSAPAYKAMHEFHWIYLRER